MRKKEAKSLSGKFTLVELLIVIAIIAILASLLFPALSKTRERVRQIQCTSNLKQISSAAFSYTNDYQDFITVARYMGAGATWSGYATLESPSWYYKLAPYLNVRQGNDGYCRLLANSGGAIMAPVILTCPSHKYTYPSDYPVSYCPGREVTLSLTAQNLFKCARVTMIKRPSEKTFLSEWTQSESSPTAPPCAMNERRIIIGDEDNVFSLRHLNSGNILFFDGHCMRAVYKDVMSPAGGSIRPKGLYDIFDAY